MPENRFSGDGAPPAATAPDEVPSIATAEPAAARGAKNLVIFVCQHGGAKSVIAASYFNRLADERALAFHATAASAGEPYTEVPAPVAELLEKEGFDVRSFKPQRVDVTEVAAARRIIRIGCDTPNAGFAGAEPDDWNDIPMASIDPAGSARAIRQHVELLVTKLQQPDAATDRLVRPSLRSFVTYFLRLGTIGFGGPIALAGSMQRDLVDDRRWVTRQEYLEGLALAQLAPGPLAAQLAIYLGWVRAGIAGATLVAAAFVAPSFLMVLAISVAYVRLGGLAWMQAAFYGIGAAVIAMITRSAYKLVRLTLENDRLLWAICLTNAAVTAMMEAEVVSLIVGCGLVTLGATSLRTRDAAYSMAPHLLLTASAGLSPPTSGSLFWFFSKAGAFVFGSGLAIVPFLYGGVVRDHQWLTDQQFLDAIAVAMITPGPVVITVAFIGYLVDGFSGALVAALGVFLPCYLFVIVPAPFYARFADNPRLKAFVSGVSAAATGAIGGAAIVLARRAIIDVPTLIIFAATLACLIWLKRVPEPVVIAIIGILSVLLRAG